MDDDDRVVAQRRDVLDQLITAAPKREVFPVALVAIDVDVAFSGIGVDEHESGGVLLRNVEA